MMGVKKIAVAIDGPSGAGKSTVARILAKELGFVYVDTGAMYRSVALYGLMNGCDLTDKDAVERIITKIKIELKLSGGMQRIFLNGEDVTDRIRTQEVADGSSKVAVIEKVRKEMTEIQRSIAKDNDVVMDGRDIGTYVLPDAQVKIYMDASVSTRALRRQTELCEKGIKADLDVICREIEERDYRDKSREHSPLCMAEDAVLLDTSEMTAIEAAYKIMEIIKVKGCV